MIKVLVSFVAGLLVAIVAFLVLVDREEPASDSLLPPATESQQEPLSAPEIAAGSSDAEVPSAIERPVQSDGGTARETNDSLGASVGLNRKYSELAIRAREALLSETEDANWAPKVEAELTAYSVQQSTLTRFGVPEIECRSTWCEVKLTTYQADGTENWTALLREGVTDYRWQDQWFINGFEASEQDGATTVVWYLKNGGSFNNPEMQLVMISSEQPFLTD